jgi:hypothetical protein
MEVTPAFDGQPRAATNDSADDSSVDVDYPRPTWLARLGEGAQWQGATPLRTF